MDNPYTLSWVLGTGEVRTVQAQGFGAETMLDIEFDAICKDTRVRYAMVNDGGGIRREYLQTAA